MNKVNKKIKILLVDDHDIVLLGLKSLIQRNENFEIIAQVKNGVDAIKAVKLFSPDIVILDIDLPDFSGIAVCEEIIKINSEIKVLLHTSLVEHEWVSKGLLAGASGYLPKKFEISELFEAINTLMEGKKYFRGEVAEVLIAKKIAQKKNEQTTDLIQMLLTKREKEILLMTGQGKNNKEIAEALFISVRTVEVHKSNIMKKVGVNSSLELVRYALVNFDLKK